MKQLCTREGCLIIIPDIGGRFVVARARPEENRRLQLISTWEIGGVHRFFRVASDAWEIHRKRGISLNNIESDILFALYFSGLSSTIVEEDVVVEEPSSKKVREALAGIGEKSGVNISIYEQTYYVIDPYSIELSPRQIMLAPIRVPLADTWATSYSGDEYVVRRSLLHEFLLEPSMAPLKYSSIDFYTFNPYNNMYDFDLRKLRLKDFVIKLHEHVERAGGEIYVRGVSCRDESRPGYIHVECAAPLTEAPEFHWIASPDERNNITETDVWKLFFSLNEDRDHTFIGFTIPPLILDEETIDELAEFIKTLVKQVIQTKTNRQLPS